MKLLEYAALGIPAVATRLPLVEEYLGEDAVAMVSEPTAKLLSDAIVRLAGDPEARARMADFAAAAALRHHWNEYAVELQRALRLTSMVAEPTQ